MKVFVALFLALGSVAARGSGPYLPSGWRPEGPAFYLPSEVAKPVGRTVQEPLVEETEASGSDALREYGPPKLEVLVDVNQGLPDVATEQTFFRALKEDVTALSEDNVEANTELVAGIVEEVSAVTESQNADVVKSVEEEAASLSEVDSTVGSPASELIEQKVESSDIIQSKEIIEQEENIVPTIVAPEDNIAPTAVIEEVVVPLSQQELVQDAIPTPISETLVSISSTEQELVPEAIPTADSVQSSSVTLLEQQLTQYDVSTPTEEVSVEKVAEGVNNIAEAISNLEKEVKTIQVQAELNSEITSSQAVSGSLEQEPVGFLEYGPPGFLEYGPPKQEALQGLAAEVASSAALENNEVRRRRFSPKFRSTKKH